jgi:L-ascorbate metabolism protein UlaG (beta-lactamase superfamily)
VEIDKTLFWIGHASFYIKLDNGTIFIDPFNVGPSIKEKADLILITHAHMDHCSKNDIKKVSKPETEIICSKGCFNDGDFKNFTVIEPGFSTEWRGTKIGTIPAYNVKQERLAMHPKANGWVGYIVDVNGFKIYHAGDTDFIDEMRTLKNIGASLLPAGGHYVMDVDEAMEAARVINAKYAVPIHYKALLGKEGTAAAEAKWKKLRNALIMKEVQEPMFSFGR